MNFLVKAWYARAPWLWALLPLGLAFRGLANHRRRQYQRGRRAVHVPPVPLIVVGNITAGGTGKTPLVLWLARELARRGYTPGIISRGHGSRAPAYPHVVQDHSTAVEAGDEALLLARNSDCPVVIAPDRVAALKTLLADFPCDVVISDDGLQHYALGRSLEIAVVDGSRGLGNGLPLPAGPLREARERLDEVDLVVCNGPLAEGLPAHTVSMDLRPLQLCNLVTGERRSLATLPGDGRETVHAVAGIGNPQRFFNSLFALGFAIMAHAFRDHHVFSSRDLEFDDDLDIIMTEKDAVKCQGFATSKCWYLQVEAALPDSFLPSVMAGMHGEGRATRRAAGDTNGNHHG